MTSAVDRRIRSVWAFVAAGVLVGGCTDRTGPKTGLLPAPILSSAIVSSPVPSGLTVRGSAPARSTMSGPTVVYVSLPPGAIPIGVRAQITDVGTGGTATAAMVDGGFDPVALAADAGDTLVVDMFAADVETPQRFCVLVPIAGRPRPPVVVRTDPSAQKRDVPLNATLLIVLSDPFSPTTLANGSVQLFQEATPIAGTLAFVDSVHTVVAFTPSAPLAPLTAYQLVVTPGVEDVNGDSLAAAVTIPFTTGAGAVGPPVSLTIAPAHDTLLLGGFAQLTAVVTDAAGRVVPGTREVRWTSPDPYVVGVDSTGQVLANYLGAVVITATSVGLNASDTVTVVPPPGAHLVVLPAQDTVALGESQQLNVVLNVGLGAGLSGREGAFPSVASSNPSVATVDSTGVVTGVALGTSLVTATFDGLSGTATVTVVPAQSSLGTFVAVGSMSVPRADPTATLLADGTVLVTGGGSAEVYDPATRSFVPTGKMIYGGGISTLLQDGRVLFVGGSGAELYDPISRTFSATGSPSQESPQASWPLSFGTLLPNGQVLLTPAASDTCGTSPCAARAQIYDPSTGTFAYAAPYAGVWGGGDSWAPEEEAAVLLGNGTVLIDAYPTAELYDPVPDTFKLTDAEATSSTMFSLTATLLPTGSVLLAGGNDGWGPVASGQLYDPGTGQFAPTGSMSISRDGHTATLLANGTVLVTGGESSVCAGCEGNSTTKVVEENSTTKAEVYNPSSGTFRYAGQMTVGRWRHAAVALRDGTVLIVGGIRIVGNGAPGWTETTLASAELFVPNGTSQPRPAASRSRQPGRP